MPNDNTHVHIAHEVAEKCGEPIRKILFSHMKEYYLGSIIYDSFKYSKGYVHFSRRLHGMHGEKTNTIVLDCLDFAKDTHDKGSLSAVFGMITHAQTDIHFHPMVYAVTGKDMYRHMLLENAIDKNLNNTHYAHELVYPNLVKRLGIAEVFARHLKMEPGKATSLMRALLWRQLKFGNICRSRLYPILKPFLGDTRGMFYTNPESIKIPDSYKDPITGTTIRKDIRILAEESINSSVELIDDAYMFYNRRLTRKDMENFMPAESLISGRVGAGIGEMLSGP